MLDLISLIVEPRRTLAVTSGVLAVFTGGWVWIDTTPMRGAVTTVLCLVALVTAFPAVQRPRLPGFGWLAVSLAAYAAGLYVGFIA